MFTLSSLPLYPTPLQDLDQLRRLLEPIVGQLERAASEGALLGAGGRDASSLALLVRRTKEYLSML